MDDGRIRNLDRYRISAIAATLSRLGLGAVFVYAAVPKLLDWHGFADMVARYRMLPDILVDLTALFMPALELVVGLLLIMGVYRQSAAWATILMNIVFMIAMGQALLRGLDTSCGCFTGESGPMTWWDMGRDVVFIMMAWLVVQEERRAG